MGWTEEDTEILQISNRVRQLICKRDPATYAAFMDQAYQRHQLLSSRAGNYEFLLLRHGTILINDVSDRSKVLTVFRVNPLQAKSRPDFKWDKEVVCERVVPLLDAEMVLDDLSLI